MKKIIILMSFLLTLVGCVQEYPGEYRMICEYTDVIIPSKIEDPDDFKKEWINTITIDAVDNYIYHTNHKFEFLIDDAAINYLNNELDGNKEELLKLFVEIAIGNSREFYNNIDKHNFEYKDDKIIVIINEKYDVPKKSWRTLIIPDESNFRTTYKNYSDSKSSKCTITEK